MPSIFSRLFLSVLGCLAICLGNAADDQDDTVDIQIDVSIVSSTKLQESSSSVNNNNTNTKNNNNHIDDLSAWIINKKDILHPSLLLSKYSDIYEQALEIRSGIAEFNINTELVLMHPIEFEIKLTG